MRNNIYTLPEIRFVAGQTNTFQWHLFIKKNVPYNAEGCTGNFAVVDYSDKTSDPLISKSLTFKLGDENELGEVIKNIASVDLLSDDTKGLYGKYIYQITIKNVDGEAEIPDQGILLIHHNINESYL